MSRMLQVAKPRPSVTIMYILQVQVIFDAIKESCHALILSLTCKGLVVINSLLLMYIDTLWFDILVSVSLHCGDYYNCAHIHSPQHAFMAAKNKSHVLQNCLFLPIVL